MAKIGMRYPVYRTMTINTDASGNETVSFGQKKVLGAAISSNVSVNYTEAELYGDDGLVISVKEFASGTVTITTDDIEEDAEAELLGAEVDESGDGDIESGGDDVAPYVQLAYIAVRMKRNGTKQYRGIRYNKVQFSIPSEDYQTKGQSITFGTPTLSGTLALDSSRKWRRMSKWVNTEKEAQDWVDEKMSET